MKTPIRFLFIVIAIMAWAVAATAQTPKVAFVNSETILRELPEAQAVSRELESTVKGWQDELERMGKELQDGVEDYQKKQALMDPTRKGEREQQLQGLQMRMREFQYQKFDNREGEAVRMREEKFAPIQDKVLKAIEVVAKEDGFHFVLDKVGLSSNLLYADAKFDLTYKVIDRLKRGTATRPAKP